MLQGGVYRGEWYELRSERAAGDILHGEEFTFYSKPVRKPLEGFSNTTIILLRILKDHSSHSEERKWQS